MDRVVTVRDPYDPLRPNDYDAYVARRLSKTVTSSSETVVAAAEAETVVTSSEEWLEWDGAAAYAARLRASGYSAPPPFEAAADRLRSEIFARIAVSASSETVAAAAAEAETVTSSSSSSEEEEEEVPASDAEVDGVRWSPPADVAALLAAMAYPARAAFMADVAPGSDGGDDVITTSGGNGGGGKRKRKARGNGKEGHYGTVAVVCLDNMVGAAEADDPTLREEVGEECHRYGAVVDVVVHSAGGRVRIFVVFGPSFRQTAAEGAAAAIAQLQGRLFGGRQVRAALYDTKSFEGGHFDLSA